MRRKKLLLLLVLLAGVEKSSQEDYEEEVFLNKCELDTTKIYDSLQALKPDVHETMNVCIRETKKVESDLDSLKSALTAEFAISKRQMTQERDQVVQKVEGDLDGLKSALAAEFAISKRQMTQERDQVVQKVETDLINLKADLTTELATLKNVTQDGNEAVEKVESDLESLKSALTAELTTAKRQMTQERDKVVQKVEGELERLKSALTAEFETSRGQMTRERDQVVEKVETNLENLKSALTTELASLKNTTQELNQAVEKLSLMLTCDVLRNKTKGLAMKKLSTGTYVYENTLRGHDAALEWCVERGMRLARFKSLEEMKVVKENAPLKSSHWVGAYNDGTSPPDYRWSDGTKVATQFWQNGFPKNYQAGKKTCAFLNVRPGENKLWDWDCGGICYTVCEVDAQFSKCL